MKKHQEDLQAAKGWLAIAKENNNKIAIQIIENLFPELKESEDEKIRKELIEFVNINTISIDERHDRWIAWLEKQGKNNMCISEATKRKLEYNLNKTLEKETPESWDKFLEKQGERKSTDKLKPKFKVGDWITNGEYIWKVTGIGQLDYILQSQNGDTVDDTISYVDEYFHLWTIQDAKDGDVLVDKDNNIGIYKEIESIYWNSYIYLGCDGKLIGFSIGGSHKQIDTNPATKEQRDLLFQKMLEAGYEWDAENKDLYYATDNALYHKKLVEWSEEDEYQINTILHGLDLKREIYRKEGNQVEEERYNTQYNWLKSLKSRFN